MPPKKSKTIPQCFIPSTDDPNKYICTLCREYRKGVYEKAMGYQSIRNHMQSQYHLASQACSSRPVQEEHLSDHVQTEHAVLLSAPPVLETRSIDPPSRSYSVEILEELAVEGERRAMTSEESLAWINEEIKMACSSWGSENDQCDTMGVFDADGVASDFGLHLGGDMVHEDDEDFDNSLKDIGDNVDAFCDIILPREDHTWFPYPNKTMCVLDALDHLPRQRISDALMKMILWAMKETGSLDVPSFKALRTLQCELRKQSPIQTREFKSVLGNIFYMNDISAIISNDLSNQSTRKQLHFYPEESLPISEVWHGDKWCRDMTMLDCLTPMIICPNTGTHIYVDEVARLSNKTYVIPKRWIVRDKVMHADAFLLERVDEMNYIVLDDSFVDITASDIEMGYTSLEANHALPSQIQYRDRTVECTPNPLRSIANGLPMYTIMIDVWHDDVSGNRSKSYNKHNNTYFAVKNLPRKTLQQECHVHFAGTSQYASPLEQAAAVKEMVEATHKVPVVVFDSLEQQQCCFRVFVNALPADNPMQSDLSSHIGGQGNCMCRKCLLGGTAQQKESVDGFQALFKPGIPRTASQTSQAVYDQLLKATEGVALTVKTMQTNTGVKDKIAQVFIDKTIVEHKQNKKGTSGTPLSDIQHGPAALLSSDIASIMNPFLSMPALDPHSDTPVELLHTVLLGLVKYAWHMTHTPWKANQKALYTQRLQSTDINGMSIPPIRAGYIMQYANSLIGRQFKIIVQTAAFHLHDLVPPNVYRLWKSIGSLATFLWFPEIDKIESYLADMQVCLDNMLDSFALIDPTKMVQKVKLHILAHIVEDIRRFGPLLGESTEVFESYNAVFRSCSIMSNHRAPSRDIALQLAELEGAKQRLFGGYWCNNLGQWVRASPSVRRCFATSKQLQGHLGWSVPDPFIPGTVKVSTNGINKHIIFQSVTSGLAINKAQTDLQARWVRGDYVICSNGDRASRGNWVFTHSTHRPCSVLVGKITEILVTAETSARSLVSIQRYEISATLHPYYGMPVLYEPHGEQCIINVSGIDLILVVNVQHDCHSAKCDLTGTALRKMERKESAVEEKIIQHTNLSRYVLNLNAFHNAHIIQRILPRELTAPVPLVPLEQRTVFHEKIASALHIQMTKRRTTTQEKRAAKLALTISTQASASTSQVSDALASAPPVPSGVVVDNTNDIHVSKRKRP